MEDVKQDTATPALDRIAKAKADLGAALAALAEEERACKKKAEDEKRLVAQRAELAKLTTLHATKVAHFGKLLEAIRATLPDEGFHLYEEAPAIDEERADWYGRLRKGAVQIRRERGQVWFAGACDLHIEMAYTHGHYRTEASGLKITLGNYGCKRSYPQKADTTFSYAKIAAEFASRYRGARAAETRKNTAVENEKASEALVAALGDPERVKHRFGSGPVQVTGQAFDGGKVYVKVAAGFGLKPADAEAFVRRQQELLDWVASVQAQYTEEGGK